MLVGLASDKQRRPEGQPLMGDPRLGRQAKLLIETPLQRTHIQPNLRRQQAHIKAMSPDNYPKFVRVETRCLHT